MSRRRSELRVVLITYEDQRFESMGFIGLMFMLELLVANLAGDSVVGRAGRARRTRRAAVLGICDHAAVAVGATA